MNDKKFLGAASAVLMTVSAILALVLAPGAWAAGKYKTLYKFTGGADGFQPRSGVVFDSAGNLYGTTPFGGNLSCGVQEGCGTVFKLTPNPDGSWTESVLHSFSLNDGANPYDGLTLDATGNLYGTTFIGGAHDCGTVFKLAPNPDGSWTESVLYSFKGSKHEGGPIGGVIFDAAGNLYGTGAYDGTVFKLSPNPDGSWTEKVLHRFKGGKDGATPYAGLIFDAAGNLYGTTLFGGANDGGTVFKLSPNPDGSWTEKVLHRFKRGKDGANPFASLIFDQAGNLYGTTDYDTVFRLKPNPNGGWTEKVLHHFTGGKDGAEPRAGLILDAAGNLYGATMFGGKCCGVVFKLTLGSDGKWREWVLHAFLNNPGINPVAELIFDAAGNLYGMTEGDGHTTFGSVFEITP